LNTLIVAPQWIGDAVMTEPLMRRLAAQGARLSVGALPWVAPVYRAMPQVAEVIEFPFAHGGLQWQARRTLARQLRGRFDAALVLPNSLKSALLPWLAGIPVRGGYQGESRFLLLNRRRPNPSRSERPPMVAHYSALAGLLFPETSGPYTAGPDGDRPRLNLAAAAVDAVLARQGLQRGAYVVVVPGAEYGPAKRWPVARWAELAALLGKAGHGVPEPVCVLGSGKEAPLGQEIAAQAGAGADVRNLAGATRLEEAFALIAGARAMVTNDTGLMHVAAAMDVPQVAVFGSSSPEHTPPLSPRAQVLWLRQDPAYHPPLDCAPCFERVCPLGHLRCLNDISAARVQALLGKSMSSTA
jgi:heptosyltransferase II